MSNDFLEIPTRLTGQPNSAADYNQVGINERAARIAKIASPGATLFLTSASSRCQTLTPSSDEFIVMPSAGIHQGERIEIFNASPTYTLDPVNDSSDADSLGLITPLTRVIFEAKQDAPSEAAHWRTIFAQGGWADAGIVAGDFSSGFGTVSNITSKIRRDGPDGILSIVWQNGTVTTGAGTIGIPFGLLISTVSLTSRRQFGLLTLLNSSGVTIFATTNSAGLGYYNGADANKIALAMNTNSGDYQASNVSDIMSSSEFYELEVKFPVAGWEIA